MKKLVLTSGPGGGKTTVLSAIEDEFRGQLTVVPEVANLLLEGGFPTPGKDLAWSPEWQQAFAYAILPTQTAIEKAKALEAQEKGHKLIVCDRGLLDFAGYLDGEISQLAKEYGVDLDKAVKSYDAVIHLESLSTADPELYVKLGRFEPLERAVKVEMALRDAWSIHPKRTFIPGGKGVDSKISQVIGIVRYLIS